MPALCLTAAAVAGGMQNLLFACSFEQSIFVPETNFTGNWVYCKLLEIGFIMFLMAAWVKKRDLVSRCHTKLLSVTPGKK